jgi:hypothetical protein
LQKQSGGFFISYEKLKKPWQKIAKAQIGYEKVLV